MNVIVYSKTMLCFLVKIGVSQELAAKILKEDEYNVFP